ncbi:MAG: hypothetical protein AB7F59_12725 [Bdellovibrionales bacterium]
MNLDKLTDFAIGVVIAAALSGNLPEFTKWVQIQTAKVLWASRSSTWGSPLFFKKLHENK